MVEIAVSLLIEWMEKNVTVVVVVEVTTLTVVFVDAVSLPKTVTIPVAAASSLAPPHPLFDAYCRPECSNNTP